ncbi:solute carrier organic anion transporter family member 2A1-like [Ptychodera flava]|uniref:solute carrier organic anion transporter family member 2A1-like n=1 Tax=Ptychodera flava TaxID=63121 RepID=UPI00396A6AA6
MSRSNNNTRSQNGGISDVDVEKKFSTDGKREILCFSDIRCFVASLTVTIFFHGTMAMYAASTMTTQEKRYSLNASQLSVLVSMGQAGTLLSVIPVAYFGGRLGSNRPRWMGAGVICIGIGLLMGCLPHFVLGPYRYESLSAVDATEANASVAENLCLSTLSSSPGPYAHLADGEKSPNASTHMDLGCDSTDKQKTTESTVAYALIVIGVTVVGAGYSPLLTLGTSFIDDHASHRRSALYLGIINMMWGLGPAVGYLVGAACLSIYVDFNRVDVSSIDLKPSDSKWVGAWWLGLVLGAAAFFLVSPLYFLTPGTLKVGSDVKQQRKKNSDHEIGFLRMTWKLLKNPYFMVVIIAYALDTGTTFGFLPFIAKIFQVQFGLSAVNANLYAAIFGTIPYCLGMLLPGYIIKKFNLQPMGILKFYLVVLGIGIVLSAALYPFGCYSEPVVGVGKDGVDKTQLCNEDCGCPVDVFEPVCGSDGNTYASPCHAGCIGMGSSSFAGNYTNCGCISKFDSDGWNTTRMATLGPCKETETCSLIYPFLVVVALVALLMAGREVPCMMLALRSVEEREKSFAIGLRFLLARVLGPIPIPILYGKAIDMSCSVWKTLCGGAVRGDCQVYDNHALRRNLSVLTVLVRSVSFILLVIAAVIWRRKVRNTSYISKDNNGREAEPKKLFVGDGVEMESSQS